MDSALFQVVQTGNCPSVSWISELVLYSFLPSLGMLQLQNVRVVSRDLVTLK